MSVYPLGSLAHIEYVSVHGSSSQDEPAIYGFHHKHFPSNHVRNKLCYFYVHCVFRNGAL